jgi:hypothetical protein
MDSVLFIVGAYLLLIRFCSLLQHFCYGFGSVHCWGISVVNPILFVVQACLLLIRFCCCCNISCNRVNLGVVMRNLTPVGHPMGDRLDSKSWRRFRIMELGRYIILIGIQFVATCLLFVCFSMNVMSVGCWLFVSVWVSCLLIVGYLFHYECHVCWLLVVCFSMSDMSVDCLFQYECHVCWLFVSVWVSCLLVVCFSMSGISAGCCCISVVDPVMFVVAACLLL